MPRFVMCGIPRSGSTLVWQIMRDLVPGESVPKVHPDKSYIAGDFVVASIRDPHDVVGSLYRVGISRSGPDLAYRAGLDAAIGRMVECYANLIPCLGRSHLVVRYERFYSDVPFLIRTLATAMSVEVTDATARQLADAYGLAANAKRAGRLANFNFHDADGIHGDHIGLVHHGMWTKVVPSWGWPSVREACAQIATDWGYESQR